MAETLNLTAPGRGVVRSCRECCGTGDADCLTCNGSGRWVMRACPACGHVGFDYVNGYSEDAGMIDRLGCGHRWTADDPAWLVQVLPA